MYASPAMLHVVDHPLIRHKVGYLRDQSTSPSLFRAIVTELSAMMIVEALRDAPTEASSVLTWSGPAQVQRVSGEKLVLCPILRAGLGMLAGAQLILPTAGVATLGLERDEETLEPRVYYEKMPATLQGATVLLLDPMLATGGSAVAAAARLRAEGAARIRGLFLISAPEGVARLERAEPEMDIYTAALDHRLNRRGYILPGLGDAGDRLFGT